VPLTPARFDNGKALYLLGYFFSFPEVDLPWEENLKE